MPTFKVKNQNNEWENVVSFFGSSGEGGGVVVETDPTVPAWAKANTKPTYTASEVGAKASGAVESIATGGTGATTAAGARTNLLYFGINPITSTTDDTTAKWAALGSGYAWYNVSYLNNQPHAYGFLISWTTSWGELFQLFSASTTGKIYFRSGNGNGWMKPFSQIFAQSSSMALDSNHYGDALPTDATAGRIFFKKA